MRDGCVVCALVVLGAFVVSVGFVGVVVVALSPLGRLPPSLDDVPFAAMAVAGWLLGFVVGESVGFDAGAGVVRFVRAFEGELVDVFMRAAIVGAVVVVQRMRHNVRRIVVVACVGRSADMAGRDVSVRLRYIAG